MLRLRPRPMDAPPQSATFRAASPSDRMARYVRPATQLARRRARTDSVALPANSASGRCISRQHEPPSETEIAFRIAYDMRCSSPSSSRGWIAWSVLPDIPAFSGRPSSVSRLASDCSGTVGTPVERRSFVNDISERVQWRRADLTPTEHSAYHIVSHPKCDTVARGEIALLRDPRIASRVWLRCPRNCAPGNGLVSADVGSRLPRPAPTVGGVG